MSDEKPKRVRRRVGTYKNVAKPQAEVKIQVATLKAGGFSEDVIAKVLGMTKMKLRRLYGPELQHARSIARAENMRLAMKAAERGNVAGIKVLEALMDKAEVREAQADLVWADAGADDKAPRRTKVEKLGKKEAAQVEATTAGVGTEWNDDLIPRGFRN